MKVRSGSNEYRVHFRKVHKGEGHRAGIDTVCVIDRLFSAEDNPQCEEVASAVARHNPKDRYDKVRGKQIALGRALKQAELPVNDHMDILKQFAADFPA